MQYDIVEPKEIERFLNEIVDDSELNELSSDVREILVEDLRTNLKAKISGEVVRRLTAEKCRAIESLIETRAALHKIQALIKENIPNLEEVVAALMLDFRSKFIPN